MDDNLNINIRHILPIEGSPYHLLLLADPSREMIDSYLPNSMCYVAEANGSTIGVYVLCNVDALTLEIKNIAVEEAFQGKGIGKLLLAHATSTARGMGFKRLMIGTGNSSVGQLYLYQQQGFEICAIKKGFFTTNYREPIFENGIQCKHMLVLIKDL